MCVSRCVSCCHSSSMTGRRGLSSFQQKRSPNTTKSNWIFLAVFFFCWVYHKLCSRFSIHSTSWNRVNRQKREKKKKTYVLQPTWTNWPRMNEWICNNAAMSANDSFSVVCAPQYRSRVFIGGESACVIVDADCAMEEKKTQNFLFVYVVYSITYGSASVG